jgi:hypothetical protein
VSLAGIPAPDPWLFPYVAETRPRRAREVLRPLVPVSLGPNGAVRRWALIDTGAENVLAASWVADAAGVDLDDPIDVVRIGIGGQVTDVAFVEVEIGLHHPTEPAERVSWRTEVGFVPGWQAEFPVVLGQVGFVNRFTVTFSRSAAMLAVEAPEVFDGRFGTGPTA